jgi:hypothetical protein
LISLGLDRDDQLAGRYHNICDVGTLSTSAFCNREHFSCE